MLIIVNQDNRADEHVALRSMFEARKRVFVDLLKWDLPVLADRFEVDHFDDPHATYLIVTDGRREHLASARLLPTTRPALLDGLFAYLVAGPVPKDAATFEITRFCLSPEIGARQRRAARDTLLAGLVEHARAHRITTYTGVAEVSWFRQVEQFGWECRLLGETAIHDGRALVALAIAIGPDTLAKLAETGIIAGGLDASAEAA